MRIGIVSRPGLVSPYPVAVDVGAGSVTARSRPVTGPAHGQAVEIRYTPQLGFDAADAAIRGAGTLGVILIAAGATVAVRRRRRPSDLVPAR